MKLFKFLARNVFQMIGGLMVGLSFPFGLPVLNENPLIDLAVFLPLGLIFLGISYYYAFVEKD
jgi:hypothetical protein